MDKRPIRRKFNDNPYILESLEKQEIYIVKFKDVKGLIHSVQVDKNVFDVFDLSEKYENSRIKEYSTKIVKSEFNIENIPSNTSLENELINRTTIKELRKIINTLPLIQKRRLIKYFFENKTYEQIAQEEKCTKRAVKFTIDIVLEKKFKKFKN